MKSKPEYIKVRGHLYKRAMDPDAALRTIVELAKKVADDENESPEATDLANAILGLDEWIAKGGFLPTTWSKQ